MSLRGNPTRSRVVEGLAFAGRLLLWSTFLALISWLAARAQPYQGYVPIWPTGGVGLALIWRHGARYWPAILAGGVALSMSVGTPFLIALGVGWLQVLISLIALLLLQRWSISSRLADIRQLGGFLLALVLATALSVPIYALRMALVFGYPPPLALAFGADYFLSALLSFLIFTPLLLSWRHIVLRRRAALIFAASIAAIALGGWSVLAVEQSLQDRLLFLLLPFVILSGLAARVAGASAAAALLTLIMVAMERTPVPVTDSILRTLFAMIAALTGYFVAAVFSERERAASAMNHRARHDSLTGLLNRYEFENRVVAALGDAGRPHALLYLDLDQFKLINDTCGHLAGDHMLRQLAGTIRRALPSHAVLARLGGDEFGVLLAGLGDDAAVTIAARLHDAIRAFEFTVGALRFSVGVSIGATSLSGAQDQSADDVLARADVACYAAKERGRNRTHLYRPADREMLGHHSDIQRASQLLAQLDAGEFDLRAQRIADLRGDDADGAPFYEVLLHRRGNDGESIGGVIDLAQRFGLLPKVDRWVIEQAARFLRAETRSRVRLSVNIGATTLESEGFRAFMLALPGLHGFAAERMVLEITEAVAVQNLAEAVETLRQLRRHGFEVALDDFGAGVASFGYLNDLPVSLVKIDGRFIRDLDVDLAAEVVIESLTRVASLRGIDCVAEWVEDLAVLPRLRKLGVAFAQGYAIHRPVPLASLATGDGVTRPMPAPLDTPAI